LQYIAIYRLHILKIAYCREKYLIESRIISLKNVNDLKVI